MDEPVLEELYLEWLYDQVGSVRTRNPSKGYWSLLRQLHRKEFVWILPNDDNRIEDGRDLRLEFMSVYGSRIDPNWLNVGCSFLEMLIALSRRLAFEAEGEPREWFWQLIDNMELYDCTDRRYSESVERHVEAVLDRIIYRVYSPNGKGGLFPLRHADRDQRDVEIWYQLCAYLLERDAF